MKTNRDLYKAIAGLLNERRNATPIRLEQYLASLQCRSRQWKDAPSISPQTFFDLLTASFVPVPGCSEADTKPNEKLPGFPGWDATLTRQIRDLRRLRGSGQLEKDKHHYLLNVQSPLWYNFDPDSYLECGIEGFVGGWEEGDDTGRTYVPGNVMTVNDKGEFTSCDPRDLKREPQEIPELSWDKLKEFLWCGQHYE